MKILIMNFSKCLRFLAVTCINLKTQLKTLTHIVDEKQVAIKDAITIISSLNTSQKLLVSEVLKLVKLILIKPVRMLQVKDRFQNCTDSSFTCYHL